MKELIRVENVTKQFGGYKALDDVSLTIPEGCVYGLLGPNGAGKTTLIRIINRITAPDSGHVWFDGHPLAATDVPNIGYLPEERGLYKTMKVGEQALYFAQLKGLSRAEATRRLKQWFVKFGIESWWNKKVSELSKGMAQKVQFITTVLHEPKLLIFDEPFSGFDPINANLLKEEILRLRDRGATIIFSTHNMASVEEICDHITLINRSRNILSGPVDDIRRSARGNTFEVTIESHTELFDGLLEGLATITSPLHEVLGGHHVATIQIDKESDITSVITRLATSCSLRSMRELIPTMNDIFIRAVDGTL